MRLFTTCGQYSCLCYIDGIDLYLVCIPKTIKFDTFFHVYKRWFFILYSPVDPEDPVAGVRVKLSVKVIVDTDGCTEVQMKGNLPFVSLRNKIKKMGLLEISK